MFSYSKFEHANYTKSEFKYTEVLSRDYKVKVNGTEIPVYTCRISQILLNLLRNTVHRLKPKLVQWEHVKVAV